MTKTLKQYFMWLSEVKLWSRGTHLEGPLVGLAPVLSAQAEGVGLRGRGRGRVLELPGRRNRHQIDGVSHGAARKSTCAVFLAL